MLFNLFYKDLIDELESCDGGVAIGNKRFNVFCYADDILIASTTVTGLQNLINVANIYITNHGLRFNPSKTTCIINGKNPFLSKPKWYIGESSLETVQHMEYLGGYIKAVLLTYISESVHIERPFIPCKLLDCVTLVSI